MTSDSRAPVRIRTRYRRDVPEGAAAHLVEIARTANDPDVLISACQWAVAAGAIKQDQRLDTFRSALAAWSWRGTASSGAKLIEAFELDQAAAISTPDYHGETAADIILDALHSTRPYAPGMIAWLELMQTSDWIGWAGERQDDPEGPGVAVYELATLLCQDPSTSVLPYLFSGGLDPNLRYPSGRPLASILTKPIDLEAFMASGGDLRAPIGVNDHDKPATTQLWERLRKTGDLRPIIDAWSSINEPDRISAKLAGEYWPRLQGYVTAQEIASRAKSHPQWDSLEDEKGRNCAMYLVGLHQSCHRFLSTKQCEGLLSKRDHQGRDLWFHTLSISNENRSPSSNLLSLLAAQAPKTPNPINGRGLLADVLLDEDFRPGLFCGIDAAAGNKRVMKALPPRKWLAGSTDDLDRVCDLIDRSALEQGNNKQWLSKFNLLGVSKVLFAHVEEIEHPRMCWTAVIALAESDVLGVLEPGQVVSLLARSGKTQWTKEEEALLTKCASSHLETIRSGLSANSLFAKSLLPSTTAPGSGPIASPRF